MRSVQPKTLAPLLILRILEEYSDENHPLTREEIERLLDEKYGITMERKAFFRHMKSLGATDEGKQPTEDCIADIRRVIIKSKDPEKSACAGFYLAERTLNELELRVIIDALSGSTYLSQWETKDLVRRLAGLAGQHFQKKMKSYQFIGHNNKTKNKTLLYNLRTIDEAISEHTQIQFDRLRTGSNGKQELSDYRNIICTPVQYFVREHNYYLVGIFEENGKLLMDFYPISTIRNVEKLDVPAKDIRSIPEFKHGVDWHRLLREHPDVYYLGGKPERCTFLCARWMLDEMRIRFGDELCIRQLSEKENNALVEFSAIAKKKWLIEVSVVTDPATAKDFAWCNRHSVWLVGPDHARRELHRQFSVKQKRYEQLGKIYESFKAK